MNQHLRAAHGTEAAGVAAPKTPRKVARQIEPSNAERIDRLTDHVNREIGVAKDVPLHLRVDEGAAGGCSQSIERVITLQLGESKVQKLLDLLLQ
jgi:hypothetical protein